MYACERLSTTKLVQAEMRVIDGKQITGQPAVIVTSSTNLINVTTFADISVILAYKDDKVCESYKATPSYGTSFSVLVFVNKCEHSKRRWLAAVIAVRRIGICIDLSDHTQVSVIVAVAIVAVIVILFGIRRTCLWERFRTSTENDTYGLLK